MKYKGFTIIAEINVNEQWEFEEVNGGIHLTGFIDSGGADVDGLADFIIENENGEEPEWAEYYYTLQEAKDAIDNYLKEKNNV